MKRLLVFCFIGLIFIGLASWVEASEGAVKTHLQMADEDLEAIDQIGKISNPDQQVQAIAQFMRKMQGFGPMKLGNAEEAAKKGLKKYAWKVAENKWWIIYESEKGTGFSGYLAMGDPPADAKILPTKGVAK